MSVIDQLGGLATKLLERLEAVPEFLENSLVPNLLNINTGMFNLLYQLK